MKPMEDKYLGSSLDLVEQVFTESENAEEGKLVRGLVEEICSKKYYVPELEFVMVDETDSPIGYVMFSRFHLKGKYEEELLLLSPAPECLMVQELVPGALEYIKGEVNYSFYESLR